MRVERETAAEFQGTHKGCRIQIDREDDGTLYILVWGKSGGHLYDGWAPDSITTMAAAKKEALYGSCLLPRPHPQEDKP